MWKAWKALCRSKPVLPEEGRLRASFFIHTEKSMLSCKAGLARHFRPDAQPAAQKVMRSCAASVAGVFVADGI